MDQRRPFWEVYLRAYAVWTLISLLSMTAVSELVYGDTPAALLLPASFLLAAVLALPSVPIVWATQALARSRAAAIKQAGTTGQRSAPHRSGKSGKRKAGRA